MNLGDYTKKTRGLIKEWMRRFAINPASLMVEQGVKTDQQLLIAMIQAMNERIIELETKLAYKKDID